MKPYINAIRTLAHSIKQIKTVKVLHSANSNHLISVLKVQKNINENASHTYQDLYQLNNDGFQQLSTGDITINNAFSSYSPDDKFHVKIQQVTEDGKPKQVIELYENGYLSHSYVASVHEDVLNNDMLGEPIVWNRDGTKFMYLAKGKAPESKTFFQEDSETFPQAHQYRKYEQSWGEQMDSVVRVHLYEFDIITKKLFQIRLNEGLISYPQYNVNNEIIFCAYRESPEFRYGIVHCFNRPSIILQITTPVSWDVTLKDKQPEDYSKCIALSNDEVSIKPVISPDGTKLVYLATKHNHQHLSYLALKFFNFGDQQTQTLIDITHPHAICGYYDSLQKIYWTKDNRFFIFQSIIKATSEIFAIDTQTSHIRKLTEQDNKHSINSSAINYDAKSDILFYTTESIGQSPILNAILQLNKSLLEQTDFNKQSLIHKTDISLNFEERILYSRKNPKAQGFVWKQNKEELTSIPIYFGEKRPLCVLLHGGPHGAVQSNFSLLRYFLLQQGFIILAPNYSGSAGFGQEFIESLSGNIGERDCDEILDMMDQLADEYTSALLYGGSYGGYLACYLGGKYGDKFKGAVILNPVTNLPFSVNSSDIPEWNTSCGLNKHFKWDLTPEDYAELFRRSPMMYPMRVPSLLLLGKKDSRVPYNQGLAWRAQAITNGTPVDLYLYPEADHSLADSVNTGFDVLTKTILFLNQHQ